MANKLKNLNPPEGRIEDCTLLAWSSIPKPRCLGEGLRYYATGRSSDFRIILVPAPSPPKTGKWLFAGVVPGYSGGTVTDLHRLPFYPEGTRIILFITSHRLLSSKGLQSVLDFNGQPFPLPASVLSPFPANCITTCDYPAARERFCDQQHIALYSKNWKPL